MTTHNKYTESRKAMEKYEEKRKYPRIIVDCPAMLQFPESHDVNVLIHDICPGGIQVRCDRETAHILKAEKEKAADDFGMSFMLPVETRQMQVSVRCRLVYMVNLEDDIFASGMQFTSMDNRSRKSLKKFIETSMEPL